MIKVNSYDDPSAKRIISIFRERPNGNVNFVSMAKSDPFILVTSERSLSVLINFDNDSPDLLSFRTSPLCRAGWSSYVHSDRLMMGNVCKLGCAENLNCASIYDEIN